MKESLLNRFQKPDIWDAMCIFHPNMFPKSAKDKATFGTKKLAVLLNHFGEKRGSNTPHIDVDTTKQEWSFFRNHMFTIFEGAKGTEEPLSVASLSQKMITSEEVGKEFPNMFKLLVISRILPVSSVECERGFSTQNLIKTRLRCSLSKDMLEQLMRIDSH